LFTTLKPLLSNVGVAANLRLSIIRLNRVCAKQEQTRTAGAIRESFSARKSQLVSSVPVNALSKAPGSISASGKTARNAVANGTRVGPFARDFERFVIRLLIGGTEKPR
jgi:hypothetical protein